MPFLLDQGLKLFWGDCLNLTVTFKREIQHCQLMKMGLASNTQVAMTEISHFYWIPPVIETYHRMIAQNRPFHWMAELSHWYMGVDIGSFYHIQNLILYRLQWLLLFWQASNAPRLRHYLLCLFVHSFVCSFIICSAKFIQLHVLRANVSSLTHQGVLYTIPDSRF